MFSSKTMRILRHGLIIVIALGAIGSGLYAVTQAQAPPRRDRPARGELLRSLNLTRTQLQQLQQVRRQYQPDLRDRRRTVRAAQSQFQDLLRGEAAEADIKVQFAELQTAKQSLQELRFESVLAMRAILTPEQRQALTEQTRRRSLRDDL